MNPVSYLLFGQRLFFRGAAIRLFIVCFLILNHVCSSCLRKCYGVFKTAMTLVNNWVGILLLFAGVGASSCDNSASGSTPQEPIKEAKSLTEVTRVKTAYSSEGNFEHLITSNGKVKSLHDLLIVAETDGRVETSNLYTGKRVAAGDILLKIEITAARFKLEKLELLKFNAEKEYQSLLIGYENLLKGQPEKQVEEIRQKLRISSGLATIEKDIQELLYEINRATLKAPFPGVIADLRVQQGHRIKVGEELSRIYDPSNLFLEIEVLESDLDILKLGVKAEIHPIADEKMIFTGAISEINPYVNENGLALVKVKIDQSKGNMKNAKLLPGMNCMATIRIPLQKAILVPKEAVVLRGNKAVVFTVDNGKAIWNYVTPGRENGAVVEIRTGLVGGQKVIVSNNLQIAHEAPIVEVP